MLVQLSLPPAVNLCLVNFFPIPVIQVGPLRAMEYRRYDADEAQRARRCTVLIQCSHEKHRN